MDFGALSKVHPLKNEKKAMQNGFDPENSGISRENLSKTRFYFFLRISRPRKNFLTRQQTHQVQRI